VLPPGFNLCTLAYFQFRVLADFWAVTEDGI
jgi:hypothetical protein